MDNMFDSGLFTELGDLHGHDPTFYEESDVSSFAGDINKHSFYTPNNTYSSTGVLEQFPSPDHTEMDDLLSEGNMLLDKLMAENGLDLLSAPVDLADVDELVTSEAKFTNAFELNNADKDLFATFYEPTAEAYQQSPISPTSTLPSEPSSPIDLFSLEGAISPEPPTVAFDGDANHCRNELDELLSSLLDGSEVPSSSGVIDYYDDQFVSSPTGSSYSESDQSLTGSSVDEFSSGLIDNESSYSLSPAPEKAKSPKKKKSSTPYSKLPANRKEKKKLQNKEAAIRYRQKKKGELQVLTDEESVLLEKNDMLKSEVLNLEREIMCMKELLSDVFNIHSI